MTKQKHVHLPDQGVDIRVALLEQSISYINETLIRIETDSKEFRKEIKEEIHTLGHDLKGEMKHLKFWVWGQFLFLFGAIGGLFTLIARGFHWF